MTAREMFEALGYEYKHYKQRISYSKTVYRTTTLIVFDLKTKQAYCECGMGLRAFNSEESKAVQQQKKELGWLEEEKAETNYEHYKDKIIKDGIWNLALVNGKPKRCRNVYCNDCDFKSSSECKKKLEEWLNQPYEKPVYKLSQFEFDLIQTYRDCHESCKFSDFKQLIELKDKRYFQCVDDNTKVQDILANCEVTK